MKIKKEKVAQAVYRSLLSGTTFDDEKLTVSVIWTTGARGLRLDNNMQGYIEELGIEEGNIRWGRLSGACVFDNHNTNSIKNVLGVVEKVWRAEESFNDGVSGWAASIRISQEHKDIYNKIKEGVIKFVSVGYFVYRYEKLEEEQEGLPIYKATDWEPIEISFVGIPFDAGAKVRSNGNIFSDCDFLIKEAEVSKEEELATVDLEKAVTSLTEEIPRSTIERSVNEQVSFNKVRDNTSVDFYKVEEEGMKKLREVQEMAELFKFSKEETRKYEDMLFRKVDLLDIYADMKKLASSKQEHVNINSSNVSVGRNLSVLGVDKAIVEALKKRAKGRNYKSILSNEANTFSTMSIPDMARSFLEARGIDTKNISTKQGLMELAFTYRSGGTHTTSDFLHLFKESIVKPAIKEENSLVKRTYEPLAKNEEVPDFREVRTLTTGNGFVFEKKKEGEEIKHGTFNYHNDTYKICTYASAIKWTREMAINDDFRVLENMPKEAVYSAEVLKADVVWDLIVGNNGNGVKMFDGNPLFCPEHKNIGKPAGINKQSVAEARKAIRQQRSFLIKQGYNTLGLEPRYLVCGAEKEQEAIDFLAANFMGINQENAAALNLSRSLLLIIEDRIIDNSWYLVAPPPAIDGILTLNLSGEEGVRIEEVYAHETDCLTLKARLDFGVHMLRWEGWFKNPGKE